MPEQTNDHITRNSVAAANAETHKGNLARVPFTDNRPEAIAQRRLQHVIANSPLLAAQRMQASVMQFVGNVQQPSGFTCWAASGYAIHLQMGGQAYASLRNFVRYKGTANALQCFDNDTACDIDEVIGQQANNNQHLTASDNGPYTQATFTNELPASPIVANIQSVAAKGAHYIVIDAFRNGPPFELEYMDPADGAHHWGGVTVNGNNEITHIAGNPINMLYFTS
jgi:hypothetical protein